MQSLLENLGLDWKLLLSQAANFIIVLVVLRLTVYGPLVKLMRERKERIEGGLVKAREADERLAGIAELQKTKLKEAEAEGMKVMKAAEERAKAEESKIMGEAARKEAEMMARAKEKAAAEGAEAMRKVEAQAAGLVKEILIKAVEMKPEQVDEAMIEKALRDMRQAT